MAHERGLVPMLGSCSFQTEVPGSAHGQNFFELEAGACS